MIPEVGSWYHLNAKLLPGANRRLFCLCIQLNEGEDASQVILYVRISDKIQIYYVKSEEIKEAIWMDTNRFHYFCLYKLQLLLKTNPSLEELENNQIFQLCFDFATQFRIYRAKNELVAIDRTYYYVEKKLKFELILQKEKERLKKIHKQLLDEYNEYIRIIPR